MPGSCGGSIGSGIVGYLADDVYEMIISAERRLASTRFDTVSAPPSGRAVPDGAVALERGDDERAGLGAVVVEVETGHVVPGDGGRPRGTNYPDPVVSVDTWEDIVPD